MLLTYRNSIPKLALGRIDVLQRSFVRSGVGRNLYLCQVAPFSHPKNSNYLIYPFPPVLSVNHSFFQYPGPVARQRSVGKDAHQGLPRFIHEFGGAGVGFNALHL